MLETRSPAASPRSRPSASNRAYGILMPEP
jgi:hypothetical protein